VDIKELEALIKTQKTTIATMTTDAASATDELDRMRGHQHTLLEETKTAKNERKASSDALAAIQTKIDDLEKKGLIHEGNYEELLTRATEKMKLDFDTKLGDSTAAFNELSDKYKTTVNGYNTEKINSELRKAAESAGVIPGAIDDVVFRGNGIFNFGDDGKIEARDSEGNLRKIGNKQMTPKNFVESLKENAVHFWPQSEGAGATGGSGKGSNDVNPFVKGKNFNITEQAKLRRNDPGLANELQKAANAA